MGRPDMPAVTLPYLQAVRARGRTYWYYRRDGRRIRLTGEPGSAEFLAAYAAAQASPTPTTSRAAPGSMAALVASWHDTAAYRGRRASTQRWDRRITDWLSDICGDRPVARMDARAVRTIVGMRTAAMGNKTLSILRALLQHAIALGWRDDDPTSHVARAEYKRRPFPTWTDDDLAAFEANWPSGTRARLAYALLLYTGQRRSDVIRMGWQHVTDGRLAVVQQKTSARVLIPIHPALSAELQAIPTAQMTFLMTATGAGFASGTAFYNWFTDCARRAGIEGKSPHGMRKACARRLIEAGCTPHQAAAITGHSNLAELTHYARDADREHLAAEAMQRQMAADRRGGRRGVTSQVANMPAGSGKR